MERIFQTSRRWTRRLAVLWTRSSRRTSSSRSRKPKKEDHETRILTHRVALDWLFDIINLHPKIQIKYVDTTNLQTYWQEGITHAMSGTIFCISLTWAISALSAALRISGWPAAPERWRKGCKNWEGDNRIGAKSQPTAKNLAVSVSTSSSTVNSPTASKSSGIFKASCRTDWSSTGKPDARNRNHNAASSSQVWQKDAFLDASTGKLVATEEDQEHMNFPEKIGMYRENLSIQDIQELQETQGTRKAEGNDEDWPQYLHISTNYVLNMEKVFSIVRQRNGRNPTGQMKDIDVNTAIWCIFMSVTLRAARKIHDLPRINPRNLWDSYF